MGASLVLLSKVVMGFVALSLGPADGRSASPARKAAVRTSSLGSPWEGPIPPGATCGYF